VRSLCEQVDYATFDLELTRQQFHQWEHDKVESITTYRNKSFSSPCTGTASPVHHTPWWEEFDDSMATFLGDRSKRDSAPVPSDS
jgi:trimethylamine monooxygenase